MTDLPNEAIILIVKHLDEILKNREIFVVAASVDARDVALVMQRASTFHSVLCLGGGFAKSGELLDVLQPVTPPPLADEERDAWNRQVDERIEAILTQTAKVIHRENIDISSLLIDENNAMGQLLSDHSRDRHVYRLNANHLEMRDEFAKFEKIAMRDLPKPGFDYRSANRAPRSARSARRR